MLSAWQHLSRIARASRSIPTTDLYFANACRDWLKPAVRSGAGELRRHREPLIRRIGANSFLAGDQAVVCRRDASGVVDAILSDPALQLTYVIDDDLDAAHDDESLPADYRSRLARLREGQYRALVERAQTIVVPTDHLAAKFAATHDVRQLGPVWAGPLADDSHFDRLARGKAFQIAYLGSVTHGADRAFVIKVLEAVLAARPDAAVTMIARGKLGCSLDGHPRLRLRRPLPWALHRARHARLRFHLALYPMLDTPFNRGRSINKVIEHAVLGAVGLYSADWVFADRIRDGETGFLAPNEESAWVAAILSAMDDPAGLRAMQAKARAAAQVLNDPTPQRLFWGERLGLEGWRRFEA
ncbi:hypothetical protein [Breoghania corrubedonensis]|uniref:hypothetical protein n=1 Tax=Breoghania corrubedonensis TaxID=665038 RepID=UPI0011B29CF5|nr:hypothetical protein [Breoghania corrubedonensis]